CRRSSTSLPPGACAHSSSRARRLPGTTRRRPCWSPRPSSSSAAPERSAASGCAGLLLPPGLQRGDRPLPPAVAKSRAVVLVRERCIRYGHLQELAQRLPPFADLPHEQPLGGDRASDPLVEGDHLL